MPRRSLWPREHGAYFQLAIPLAVALARAPSLRGAAFAMAAAIAFLANEPLLIVRGHRGARRRRDDGAAARRRLAWLVAGAGLASAAGLAGAPGQLWLACAVAAIPAAAAVGLAWTRAQHSLAGELVAAAGLTGASAPVAVAGGAGLGAAAGWWLAWGLGFAATIVAVHRVLARRRAASVDRSLGLGLPLAAVVLALGPLAPATPLVAIAAVIVIAAPPPARVRTIGVAIAGAGLASAALALTA